MYPTTAELVAASSVPELTALTAEQQDALRAVAIANVERYTGDRFEPLVGDLPLDGSDGRDVWPPRRIEELTGVAVSGTDIDLTDVQVLDDGNRLAFAPLSSNYAVQAMRETSYDTRTFRSGPGSITLTGTFGWTVCPPAVEQAIRLEMEDLARVDGSKLSGLVASARRMGLRDVSQGNLRLTMGAVPDLSPMAAVLLSDFVRTPAGALV